MEVIKREKDIINHEAELEELYCFQNFPVHMNVSDKEEDTDLYADLRFQINRKTGMISIRELVDESILYQTAHYNNVGKNWREHHKAFAEFINKYLFSNVFEIGGGTGILSSCFYDLNHNVSWTILDSVPNKAEECHARYLCGFFDEHYKIPQGFDAVVHTHTLEHFYYPLESMRAIGNAMENGSWLFMSVPNMEEMFKKHYTNVMNFEHTYYCAEPYITYMLNISGYKVIERQLFKEDHSVFYAAQKMDKIDDINELFFGCYNKNKNLFNEWVKFHNNLIFELNKKLAKVEYGQSVYLFGAHVYSQFLISFGMNIEKVKGILDNDRSKQGKRLCGTALHVLSPDVLKEDREPVVILHAGVHNDEICQQIKEINSNTIFM